MRWRDDEESSDEESDSTVDSEDEISLNKTKQKKKETQNTKQKDFEVVPIEDNSKYIFWVNVPQCFTLCKEIGIPESGKFLPVESRIGENFLMESEILDFGIQKTAQGINNSTNNGNPESKFYWQRLAFSTWNLESIAWNPESKTVLDSPTWGEMLR